MPKGLWRKVPPFALDQLVWEPRSRAETSEDAGLPKRILAQRRYLVNIKNGRDTSLGRLAGLRSGPGMGLACLDEGENGHDHRENGQSAVANDGGDCQGLRRRETAAIDLHACGVAAHHRGKEAEN